MDKETLLQTYIDIETTTYVRSEKTKRLGDFVDEIKKSDLSLSLEDSISIVQNLFEHNITIRHPFFLYVIYPALAKGVDNNDTSAIKLLIQLFGYYGNFQNVTSDNKYTGWTLLKKGLQLAPFDKELLSIYEKQLEYYFDYTLHELPVGVLYESNGASIEECDELLKELADYEDVCKKLAIDRQELINDCKFYYNVYKAYLAVCKSYNGFADYLDKHDLAGK